MTPIKKIDEMKINESWLGDKERKVLDFPNRRGTEMLAYAILHLITEEVYTLPKDLVEGILKYEHVNPTTDDWLRIWRCL